MNIELKRVTHQGFWSIVKGPRFAVGSARLRPTASV